MKYTLSATAFITSLLFALSTFANQGNTRNKSSNAYRNNYKRLTAGSFASYEIRGGKLYSWGSNFYGQLGIGNNTDQWVPVAVGVSTNWVSIGSGDNQTIALKSDGTLWTTGKNNKGQLGIGNTTDQNSFVQVGTDNKWVVAATGSFYCAAIKSDGTLWTWGYNSSGQLGLGNTTDQNAPTQVGTDTHWVRLACGGTHMLAIKSDGTLWAWGSNGSGELGIGNTTQQTSPVQVGTDRDWVSISAGGYFSAALKSNGTIWTTGLNNTGQLGQGNFLNLTNFTQVGTDNNWVVVSCGTGHMHGLKSNGTLWSWGAGSGGRLGNGNTSNQTSPLQIGTSHNWTDVSAGNVFGIGIQAGGRVFAWGANGNGQLGIGNTTQQLNPVPTSTPAVEWINISTGGNHTVGVRSEGSLWVWGANGNGQLGTGNTTDIHFPYQMDADTTWVGVAAGNVHTLAIKANGTLWAWGGNANGQLGNGNNADQHSPVQVGNDTSWVSISAGRAHSVGLKSDGTIWTWGVNTYGQLGNGNNTNTNAPAQVGTDHDWISIMAGSDHTLALKSNGTLWAWGYNAYGQLGIGNLTNTNVPTQIGTATDWAMISAGGYHSVALKGDGTMYAWGYNLYGQLGLGNNTNAVSPQQIGTGNTWIGITTGENHSFAFKTDGTGMSWGYNTYGQLGLNNNTNYNTPQTIPSQSGIVQLFCGAEGNHSTLIKDARDLVCLAGRNTNGQLGDNSLINKNNYNCITICTPVLPAVHITVSPNDTLCGSQTVTFTATPTNGGPTPTYQWYKNGNPVGTNSAVYVDNTLTNGNTIVCSVTSSTPCAFPNPVSDTVHMVITTTSNALAGNVIFPESMTTNVTGPVDVRYYTDCDLMASITPSGVSPIGGNTTTKVTIDNAVYTYNGQPYVQRHFDIEPAANAAGATATIKLYAYQAEFDQYNLVAAVDGLPLLPTGTVDNGNVVVSQFHGTGTLPGNYTGGEVLITPAVTWDAVHNWWVLSFPVTGFSGFYIHTAWGHALDISITDISAQNAGSSNRVDWITATEKIGGTQVLQRSADGVTFSDLATVSAKGQPSYYSYWDEHPFNGVNYYRLKLGDASGNVLYTRVVSATLHNGNNLNITVTPNPVRSTMTVSLQGGQQGKAVLTLSDITGKELQHLQPGSSKVDIDMSALSPGLYLLKYKDDAGSVTAKVEKVQ
ncbi:MAG: T9SS type A sorting domain-containing protein [Bacteroidetes bacterium]|nr:T9SS type A sorting domain-containing protein [Bacteroidota bacterium]